MSAKQPRKVLVRPGFTTGRDKCKVGALVERILKESKQDLLVTSDDTPLKLLESELNSGKDVIQVNHLCIESDYLPEEGCINVRVYDYLQDGKCVLDIKYNDKFSLFLRGCYNLARSLQQYFEAGPKNLEKVLE